VLKVSYEPVLMHWPYELVLMHLLVWVRNTIGAKVPDSFKRKPFFVLVTE
jgi:hypothetical protein